MQSLHHKLRAMRAGFAAQSSDFPSLAKAFVHAYDTYVQNANRRLENVESMLAEYRYDEADALLWDEPPLLELCDTLQEIEADKQGGLSVCKVGLKRAVDSARLARVKSASASRTTRKQVATPPPLPATARAGISGPLAVSMTPAQTRNYLMPLSIGIGAFGVVCLIAAAVILSMRSTSDLGILASLDLPPATTRPEKDEGSLGLPTLETADPNPTKDGTTINEPINADSKDAASSSEVEETYPVLVAQIQASKLLKGDVCVRLEIQDFTDISFKEARFSHEKSGRGYSFEGSLTAEGRPSYIKHLEFTLEPFKIIVEIESKDKELKELASKIRDGWTNVSKAVVDWQNALGKSRFPRPQALELVIEKPAEPKSTSSVQDLQQQLNALLERAEQVVEKLAEHEADRAAKSSVEEAKAHFQRYREGLKKFQEHIASLQLDIDSLTKIDREFDTGIIMYVGKAEGGRLVDPAEVRTTFLIDHAN